MIRTMLITGGTGFIGRSLIEFFNKNSEYNLYYPTSKELDLLDETSVKEYLKRVKPDVVIHAANYGIGMDKSKDEKKVLENILRMFYNLQKNSALYGRMFHLGSGAEYDKRYPIVRVSEEEIGRTIPIDQYGLAKYTINELTQKSNNIYNLRLFGIFGPYEYYSTKFISNICCKAIKGINLSIRQNVYFDYLWIEDFCRIVSILLTKELEYHTYNVTTGHQEDLISLAELVIEESGKKMPLFVCREGLGNEYTADNTRLMKVLGKFSFTDKRECIHKLYNYYRSIEKDIDILCLLYT